MIAVLSTPLRYVSMFLFGANSMHAGTQERLILPQYDVAPFPYMYSIRVVRSTHNKTKRINIIHRMIRHIVVFY